MISDVPPVRAVAVIVAVRNGMPHVVEAVESALRQRDPLDEVIVVDDGSSDGTVEAVASMVDPRVRLVANTGSGVSSARNTGAAASRAPWLLFLDADDRLAPGALETLLAARDGEAVVVYGDYERIDEAGRSFGRRHLVRTRRDKPSGNVLETIVGGNFLINGGILICSTDAFTRCNGFDINLSLCEDWHLWCRLAAIGPMKYVPRHILDYRVHVSSVMLKSLRRFADFDPAVRTIFADPLIVRRLRRERMNDLRRLGETNLMTYCAQQAVRARRYRTGMAMMLTAVKHFPRRMPWIVGRVVGAVAGI